MYSLCYLLRAFIFFVYIISESHCKNSYIKFMVYIFFFPFAETSRSLYMRIASFSPLDIDTCMYLQFAYAVFYHEKA